MNKRAWTQIAILAGSSLVIEAIVFEASKDSGIPMDWHYCGGRAAIYALGDAEKAKEALGMAYPTCLTELPYHYRE